MDQLDQADDLARYLTTLQTTGRKAQAAREAVISNKLLMSMRKESPDFAEAEEDALRLYGESLEQEAHRRGVEGVDEPVFYKGAECGQIRRYSDRMLELLLKKNCPEFRDKLSVDANVRGGVLVVGEPAQTPADWAKRTAPKP